MRFNGAFYGASVGFGQMQNKNVARNAFHYARTIPQYMTMAKPNLLWNSLFVSEGWNRDTNKIRPLSQLRSTVFLGFAFLPSLPCIKASRCSRNKTVAKLRPAGCSSEARRLARLPVRGLLGLRASPRCFRAPRKHSRLETKREDLRPWGVSEMGSSSEAAVRCNKKIDR